LKLVDLTAVRGTEPLQLRILLATQPAGLLRTFRLGRRNLSFELIHTLRRHRRQTHGVLQCHSQLILPQSLFRGAATTLVCLPLNLLKLFVRRPHVGTQRSDLIKVRLLARNLLGLRRFKRFRELTDSAFQSGHAASQA